MYPTSAAALSYVAQIRFVASIEVFSAMYGYRCCAAQMIVSVLRTPGIQMRGCGCWSGSAHGFTTRC